jgi:hypothetical protein
MSCSTYCIFSATNCINNICSQGEDLLSVSYMKQQEIN